METARKITIRSTGLKASDIQVMVINEPGKTHPLMRIAGITSKIKPIETDYGASVKFMGQFRAVMLAGPMVGLEIAAPTLFLPPAASDMIEGAMSAGAESVSFAFDIAAVRDESVPIGYQYKCTSLIEPDKDDPVSMLMGSLPKLPVAIEDKTEKAEDAKPKGKAKA